MAGMIDSFEAAVLDHIMAGNGTTVSPTNWYLALYTAAPNEDGTGGTEVSTSSTAYARQTLTSASWDDAAGAQPSTVKNVGSISFPQATASWGTVTHFGLCASGTEGTADVKIWGALDTSKTVNNGDTVTFAADALIVQLGDPGDSY